MLIKLILFKCFYFCCYLLKVYDKWFIYVSMIYVMKILVIFVIFFFGFKVKIMIKIKIKIMCSDIDRNYFFVIYMVLCVKDVNVIFILWGFDFWEFGIKEEYVRFEV